MREQLARPTLSLIHSCREAFYFYSPLPQASPPRPATSWWALRMRKPLTRVNGGLRSRRWWLPTILPFHTFSPSSASRGERRPLVEGHLPNCRCCFPSPSPRPIRSDSSNHYRVPLPTELVSSASVIIIAMGSSCLPIRQVSRAQQVQCSVAFEVGTRWAPAASQMAHAWFESVEMQRLR